MTMTTCNAPARTFTKQRPSVFRMMTQILATQSQRRALRKLDTDALRDIGLTYDDAKTEADRPFWDVPTTWRR